MHIYTMFTVLKIKHLWYTSPSLKVHSLETTPLYKGHKFCQQVL